MENYSKKLSQKELNELMQMLAGQNRVSDQSSDISVFMIHDLEGNQHNLGGNSHRVIIDQNDLPNVVAEQHGRVLSCGHSINSINEVGGKCSHGHIVCKQHRFYICSHENCRKILCDLEVVWDDEGNPKCPNHDSGYFFPILIGIFLIAVAIKLLT